MPARKSAKTPDPPQKPQDETPKLQSLGTPQPAEKKQPKITRYPNGTERRDY